MSNQVGLLPKQDKEEALWDLARIDGVGGWKGLAVFLNPKYADDPEAAGKWLRRALTRGRREVLHDDQMRKAIRLGISYGYLGLWHWYCDSVGCKPSDPAELKSRRLMLLEEDTRLSARRSQIQRELEEIESESRLQTRRRTRLVDK